LLAEIHGPDEGKIQRRSAIVKRSLKSRTWKKWLKDPGTV